MLAFRLVTVCDPGPLAAGMDLCQFLCRTSALMRLSPALVTKKIHKLQLI